MTYSQDTQLSKFGLNAEVVLVDFVIKAGRIEAKLPSGLMNRQDLDLTQEGVKSRHGISEIYRAIWQGEQIDVADHRGDVVALVKPGEEVSLTWGRNKLTALMQWLQDLGEFVSRKDGWMFAKSDLPEVMERVEFIQRRRDQILDVLVAVHGQAQAAYNGRIDRIAAKLQVALEADLKASEALVEQENRTAEGVTRDTRVRHGKIQRQLDTLPEFTADLRGRFPSVAELRSGFIFSNTTPKELPSMLSSLQGNAEAMNALVEAETAQQGQAYGRAIQNGIALMSDTIREKVAEMGDQFYGAIADALGTLEDLGDSRKFGPKVRARVENHLQRLGVLTRLLAGFNALQEGGDLDQAELMRKVQEFQQAFEADAEQGKGIGNGREALLERLQAFRLEISASVLGSNLANEDGGERLADWVQAGLELDNPYDAEAPITEAGTDMSELTVLL